MGAQCCTASTNKNHQILAQKTEQTIDEQPNQQLKKQIEHKKNQQNTLKTNFYGSAGIACSKTMTTQKSTHIENVVQDYKGNKYFSSGKILTKDKNLYKIKQQPGQDEITKKQPVKQKARKSIEKAKQVVQISTAQIIQQQANDYLQGMFNKLKQG